LQTLPSITGHGSIDKWPGEPPRKLPRSIARGNYGGASESDVKRLRELEAENAKLKRMYADLALETAAIKDVLNRKL